MRRKGLFLIMISVCSLVIGCSDPRPAPEQTPSVTVTATSVPTVIPEPTAALTSTPEPDEYIFICTTSEETPLPGVRIQICTDEVCMMQTSGEDGRIIFDGEPQQYSIHVYSYPEGYEPVSETEFMTDSVYGSYNIEFKAIE